MFQNGWLPTEALLNVETNGAYEIPNSLSSNSGMRAARIRGARDEYWLEWRESVNQDTDLRFTDRFFQSQNHRNCDGSVMTALLVKTFQSDRKSVLQAFIQPTKSFTIGEITITRPPGNSRGRFTVTGLRGGSNTPSVQPSVGGGQTTSSLPTGAPVASFSQVCAAYGNEENHSLFSSRSFFNFCKTDQLAVMSTPYADGTVVSRAARGTQFVAVANLGTWTEIRSSCTTQSFYAPNNWLSLCGNIQCPLASNQVSAPRVRRSGPRRNLMCATSNVNKRSSPKSGIVLGTAQKGGKGMPVVKSQGGWFELRECGSDMTFWVSGAYLRPCGTSSEC